VTKRCDKVNLSAEAEEAVIQFCRQHEEQLSYKSVINCVKELKYKVILASFWHPDPVGNGPFRST
jgi:hypothetical protein